MSRRCLGLSGCSRSSLAVGVAFATVPMLSNDAEAQEKRPNIVMLMTDDTGWGDFGAYSGGVG
jgi:hypothetical protein